MYVRSSYTYTHTIMIHAINIVLCNVNHIHAGTCTYAQTRDTKLTCNIPYIKSGGRGKPVNLMPITNILPIHAVR